MNEFIPKSFSIKQKKKHFAKISKSEIEKYCRQAIKDNSKATEDYKSGQLNALNFLIGQVVKLSNRRADSRVAKEVLVRLLKS
jgi:aspartyl-tRNA(Asn)/glutamyl-tRNA(Gln) amidotransferase subunit B